MTYIKAFSIGLCECCLMTDAYGHCAHDDGQHPADDNAPLSNIPKMIPDGYTFDSLTDYTFDPDDYDRQDIIARIGTGVHERFGGTLCDGCNEPVWGYYHRYALWIESDIAPWDDNYVTPYSHYEDALHGTLRSPHDLPVIERNN